MIKHQFQNRNLPALGLGCMRLPTDAQQQIDRAEVARMVDYALQHGVNYFDTGYDYHAGNSERVLGSILSDYDRESFFLADKFPGYAPGNWRKVESVFQEQLERCQVDYFDFYLLHNLSELNVDAYLNPRYHIIDYLLSQKKAGRIRHFGFSAHGSVETVERLLKESGVQFEFAMIQLNYIDYDFQHAKEKIQLLTSYGLPVWVMEPLRGGKLANPPKPFAQKIADLFPGQPFHEIAFRFVQSIPQVCLTLSGMSDLKQLKENIDLFQTESTMTASQRETLLQIAKEITAVGTVPCTACRYCTDRCPKGLDIPKLIEHYNEHTFSGGGFIVPSAIASMKRDERPKACIGCRSCESYCPQNIKISEVMADLCRKLDLH